MSQRYGLHAGSQPPLLRCHSGLPLLRCHSVLVASVTSPTAWAPPAPTVRVGAPDLGPAALRHRPWLTVRGPRLISALGLAGSAAPRPRRLLGDQPTALSPPDYTPRQTEHLGVATPCSAPVSRTLAGEPLALGSQTVAPQIEEADAGRPAQHDAGEVAPLPGQPARLADPARHLDAFLDALLEAQQPR